MAIGAVLLFVHRNARRPQRVFPLRMRAVEVLRVIDHGEAIDFEAFLLSLSIRCLLHAERDGGQC
jgi:hypothetical protein